MSSSTELHLMFSLMDKVPSGIEPMLKDLEEHIMSAGLADMVASAETITSVSVTHTHQSITQSIKMISYRLVHKVLHRSPMS